MDRRLEITPLTRIGELLDAYPALEQVLVECAPAFEKLRHPVLRRTVARVATVQRAASIAGMDVGELVATLRRAAGLDVDETPRTATRSGGDATARWSDPPDAFDDSKVEATIDADALLAAGEVPLSHVVRTARGLPGDRFLRVTSTFRPAPLIEVLDERGFRGFLREVGRDGFETFVHRPAGENEGDGGS